jgi:hypothetical protein
MIDKLTEALNYAEVEDMPNANQSIVIAKLEIDRSFAKGGSALLKDLTGQVSEAFSRKEWFNKWGKHYIRSLVRAHELQQCSNFKDFSVQIYAGKSFSDMRDRIDKIFLGIPPPKRSNVSYASIPIKSMHSYYDSGSTCFDGNCLVHMADGEFCPVNNVRKGDVVSTAGGASATIVCVIISKSSGKGFLMTKLGDLQITPWHPVRLTSQRGEQIWVFPTDIPGTGEGISPVVYNFVLSNEHTVFIDGIECVTLGHDFKKGLVAHSYFGTSKVIEDMMKLPGWDHGEVEVLNDKYQRDSKTGLVCGYTL